MSQPVSHHGYCGGTIQVDMFKVCDAVILQMFDLFVFIVSQSSTAGR